MLKQSRYNFSMCRVKTKKYSGLLIFGGLDENGTVLDSFEYISDLESSSYNFTGNKSHTYEHNIKIQPIDINMPSPVQKAEMISYNELVYITGG